MAWRLKCARSDQRLSPSAPVSCQAVPLTAARRRRRRYPSLVTTPTRGDAPLLSSRFRYLVHGERD